MSSFPVSIENKPKSIKTIYFIAVYAAVFIWLIPLFGVMLTSIRSIEDINAGNYWGWPTSWEFGNYIEVFRSTPMGQFILNSIIITIPSVIGAISLSCLSGYALSQYRFLGNVFFFTLFVGGNFVPFQILMIPIRDMAIQLNIYDTYFALFLFHTAFQSGFCTFFMYNAFSLLPKEIVESARMDGVGEFKIFWHIALPLMRPSLAALGVLIFTFVWNDFFWALVLTQSDNIRPVTSGIESLKGQWLASWQLISAGAIIISMVPVAMFFLLQRHFIAGLTMGAVK